MAFEIGKLIKFSPKCNASFDRTRSESTDEDSQSYCCCWTKEIPPHQMDSDPPDGLRPTRWTPPHQMDYQSVSISNITGITGNHSVFKQLWDEGLESKLDPDVKGRLTGAKPQISKYDLQVGLHLWEITLKITDYLSKTIQNDSMSASEAQSTAQQTVLKLEGMRNDTVFDLFSQHADSLHHTVTEEPSLPRKRKAPRQFEVGEGEVYHSQTVEEYSRKFYYEALDSAVSCLLEGFNKPGLYSASGP